MRWIFRVFGALAVLVLVAVGALFAVPADRIAQVATDRLGQATGRPVTVAGAVRPTLWPSLGISAEAVSIGNPDWVDDGPMIAADRMAVAVSWSALLSGAIVVEEATLIAPDITLVRAADGRASWSFDTVAPSGARDPAPDAPSPAEADGTAGAGFGINAARITEGRLVYRDDQAGQVVELQDVDAAIALPAAGPAQVALSAQVNGAAVSVEATIDDLAGVLDGAVGPVALALSWDGGAARFDGDLSLAPALDGTLSIVASDFVPLAALAGVAVPDLPPGAGRDRVALDGRVTLASEGSAHLRDATLQLDDNRLALALDLVPGADRPRLRGTVRGGTLAFPDSGGAAASRGASSGGTGGAAGTGWPADPIDVSGLFALDADVALALDAVRAGDFALSDVALRLTLDRGRLVFDIDRIGAYGGALAGEFVVNGRGGLSVGGDLILADVQLMPVLEAVAGYDRLQGSGSASLQFLGVGNDIATIMSGLEGQGDLAFGAGQILGLDLAGMIRNLDTSFRGDGARTVYDSVTANFTIADGVLSNDDLLLDAPWGEVTGAGRVDLGAQTLDYRLIPGVLRGEAGAARIRVPVLVTGPWASPSIRPDLEYMAEQELAEERARLEAEARERLAAEADRLEAETRERANELLGTDLQEGDTVDDARDALEQRLRDEAADQLRNLLGGN